MSKREKFYAIRMAEGEPIFGEYEWMSTLGPDDWTVAEESDHDQPTEYEIVQMVVHPVAKRTFGLWACDDCGEPIPQGEEYTNDEGTFCKAHAGAVPPAPQEGENR